MHFSDNRQESAQGRTGDLATALDIREYTSDAAGLPVESASNPQMSSPCLGPVDFCSSARRFKSGHASTSAL